MDALKAAFKFMVASTLIVGGVLVAGTVFAAKGIDNAGDKLQEKLHSHFAMRWLFLYPLTRLTR